MGSKEPDTVLGCVGIFEIWSDAHVERSIVSIISIIEENLPKEIWDASSGEEMLDGSSGTDIL